MTPKLSSMLPSTILLFLFLLPPISSHGTLSSAAIGERESPFGFIKDLQGCHKGDNVTGIQKLKNYLHEFGYLNYTSSGNQTHAKDDDFDDILESAIKAYQINYDLDPTGDLDSETVLEMVKPRCGVPDIINGTNGMLARKKRNQYSHGSLRTVAHYSFFQGSPRWPRWRTTLTYAFLPGTPGWAMGPVSRAYSQWETSTHFRFVWIQNFRRADMTISFQRLDHGDGYPFDGPGGTLAHAFSPTNGRFHYDADETWSDGAAPNTMDLETVAVHEIGHLLGLDHSSIPNAIMFPVIMYGESKGLHEDDIQGIKALYNR